MVLQHRPARADDVSHTTINNNPQVIPPGKGVAHAIDFQSDWRRQGSDHPATSGWLGG